MKKIAFLSFVDAMAKGWSVGCALVGIGIVSPVYISEISPEKMRGAMVGRGAVSRRVPWKELSKPGIVKTMVIGCAIAILGQFMGVNAVLYYGPEIFANAGFAAQDSSFGRSLVVILGKSSTAYTRKDGVHVIPLSALKP